MSYRSKMNILILLFQLTFFILYTVIFFNDVENALAMEDSMIPGNDYRLKVAIIFGVSQVVYLVLHIITNKHDRLDERIKRMDSTSTGITVVLMMLLSFISMIVLYVNNMNEGYIPIYWLWYFAYAYVTASIIIFTASNLLVPLKGTKYED